MEVEVVVERIVQVIHLLEKLDRSQHYYVGCSGGVDSMSAFHFLKQMRYNVQPLFFDHGTETSAVARRFLLRNPLTENVQPSLYTIPPKPKGISSEEHWRNERYSFFKACSPAKIILAHTLSDVAETWIWGSIHGQPKLIPYRNGNAIRPFLATPKEELIKWAMDHEVEWVEDESNKDLKYQRNYVRHVLMDKVKHLNPGIEKMLKKKIVERGV